MSRTQTARELVRPSPVHPLSPAVSGGPRAKHSDRHPQSRRARSRQCDAGLLCEHAVVDHHSLAPQSATGTARLSSSARIMLRPPKRRRLDSNAAAIRFPLSMRRFGLTLTLPLLALLLLAQQGATLHELSHLQYSGQELGAQLRTEGGLLDSAHCPACQSFAQIAHSATGSPATFVAPAAVRLQIPAPHYSIASASAPTPRSRGPPQLVG